MGKLQAREEEVKKVKKADAPDVAEIGRASCRERV